MYKQDITSVTGHTIPLKRSLKNITTCFLLVYCFITILGCDSTEPMEGLNTNPAIEELGSTSFGVWKNDSVIYGSGPLTKYIVDDSLKVLSSKWVLNTSHPMFENTGLVDVSGREERLLLIRSHFFEASVGALYELDLLTFDYKELVPDSINASNASYLSNGFDIIVYCYGNNSTPPGFYQVDRVSGKLNIIAEFHSPASVYEVINGFDVSSDDKLLYIPLVYRDKAPKILRYDIISKQFDTLQTQFDYHETRNCLWLRVSKDGKKLLYSQYPEQTFTYKAFGGGIIGVLDIQTGIQRTLDTDPFGLNGVTAISVNPSWSNDDTQIIYGAAKQLSSGDVSIFRLFGLRYF